MPNPLSYLLAAPCALFPFLCPDHLFNSAPIHRVAIVGAGAAGSSAAFWLSQREDLNIQVDVYEQASYVGGRSSIVFPYDDDSQPPAELGASIFVDANKNLVHASREFNLSLISFRDDEGTVGIWDGLQFLIKLGGSSRLENWWNKGRVLWRYGYNAPTRTIKLVQDMIKNYLQLYSTSTPKWRNVTEAAFALGLGVHAAQTTAEYLDSQGVDRKWTREVVEAATRVNYGQNADTIHALSGMVSMAASGAFGVKGGNYQLFEQFIKASRARLLLNTTVTSLERTPTNKWLLESTRGVEAYDSIILAFPNPSDSISISPPPDPLLKGTEYVHLHVTILTTTSPALNNTYFATDGKPPTTVLTSFQGVRQGISKEPPFNSISYHGVLEDKEPKEWIVKIFSKGRPSLKWLQKVFSGNVGWVARKEWEAYPVLTPRVEFPSINPLEGLYYVNAFEPFLSTMETQTIASRNVVDLLLSQRWNTSLCGDAMRLSDSRKADFVYGWDC